MSKWTEIRNDFYSEDEECMHIDGWKTDDSDEEGTTIAKVYRDGEKGTVYCDKDAETDEFAQRKIAEVIMQFEGEER